MFDLGLGGLFTGPVDAALHISDDKLKQMLIKSAIGAGYSATMTLMFETGRKKLWGEGRALQQTSRSLWLSLRPLEQAGAFILTVPQDLLDPDELAKFQTEYNESILRRMK